MPISKDGVIFSLAIRDNTAIETAAMNQVINHPLFRKMRGYRETGQIASQAKITAAKIKILRELTDLATLSIQSTVPIHNDRGGTLRNQHIQNNLDKINSVKSVGMVWVDSRIHEPLYKSSANRPTALRLAEILESGKHEQSGRPLHRTRTSEAVSPFQPIPIGYPTADWSYEAYKQQAVVFTQYLTQNQSLDAFLSTTNPFTTSRGVQMRQYLETRRIAV